VLGKLDEKVKPKTLSLATLDDLMPAWRMPASLDSSAAPSLRTSEGEAGEAAEEGKGGKQATEATEEQAAEGEGFTCSVCLCDLVAGEMVRARPCRHRCRQCCIDAGPTESSHVCPADGLPVLPDTTT